jgi:hypothetical protein
MQYLWQPQVVHQVHIPQVTGELRVQQVPFLHREEPEPMEIRSNAVLVVEVVVEPQPRVHQVEMVEMVECLAEVVVEEVMVLVPEQVEMVVQAVEVKCGFILGNKIFIKIKLWQII